MSLRSRSTIITFSARSLSLHTSSAARSASLSGLPWRGRVPLIGRVCTRPMASTCRKRSGEQDSRASSLLPITRPAKGAGQRWRSLMNSSSAEASGGHVVLQQAVRLAWNRSPAAIRSRIRCTPAAKFSRSVCSVQSARSTDGDGAGAAWGFSSCSSRRSILLLSLASAQSSRRCRSKRSSGSCRAIQRLAIASAAQGLPGSHQAAAS